MYAKWGVSIIASCSVQLTDTIHITNGAHILYTYDHLEEYIGNAVSFIITGVQQGQYIIFIDSKERYESVISELKVRGCGDAISSIKYVDSFDFYLLGEKFHSATVLQSFQNVIKPYMDNDIVIRLWGHVEWQEHHNVEDELETYENECNITVSQMGILTVCAYSGRQVTASIQTKMMRLHEYLMTDKQFARSSLYNIPGKSVIFPSLSEHTKIQSEMELYKKKLDFVHVISHEVRNPLTVIKAYASMLLNEKETLQLSSSAAKKLVEISDYVTVIDNEIAHILNTEQMLSSEALWKTSAISPLPIMEEVVTTMEIKARTQSIRLNKTITLSGHEVMNCNAIGLRLIISNLLSNAVKYSNEGSEVRFQADVNDYTLWIEIEDNGIGISAEQQEKLFRKYEKMNVDKSGQGIGLFMVKKLVDHFNGEITIESKEGSGTLARVGLPLASGLFQ